jgi:hypothetical protein
VKGGRASVVSVAKLRLVTAKPLPGGRGSVTSPVESGATVAEPRPPGSGFLSFATETSVVRHAEWRCSERSSLAASAAYFSHNWDSAFVVGQAILPAAAFPGGSWGRRRVLVSRKSRLKAGCSHDWLPHYSCKQTPIDKSMRHCPCGRGSERRKHTTPATASSSPLVARKCLESTAPWRGALGARLSNKFRGIIAAFSEPRAQASGPCHSGMVEANVHCKGESDMLITKEKSQSGYS